MNLRSITRFAVFAALVSMLSGCGGLKITGKVLPGTISYVGVVDHSDERLAQLGVGGVSIRIEATPGSGGTSATIATTTSAADGSFKIAIAKEAWSTDRVEVRALADGYAAARGSVFLPREGQSMLILMERTASD